MCATTKRLASNAEELKGYLAYQRQSETSKNEGLLSPLWSTLAEQVALEMARIVSAFSPPKTIGRLYEFEATTPTAEDHDILRLPHCPACSIKGPKHEPWDMVADQ